MNLNARFAGVITAVIIIALLAGTWFILISPRLDEASAADRDRETVVAQNSIHEARVRHLEELDSRLPELRSELDDLAVLLPTQLGYTDYVRQLERIAESTGATIRLAGMDGPTRWVGPESMEGDAELTSALGSVGPENFLTVDVTIQIEGTHDAVTAAIRALQNDGRFTLVHDLALPNGLPSGDADAEATVSGQLFVLMADGTAPAPEEVPAGGAPAEGDAPAVL